jgi:hypothetical protein
MEAQATSDQATVAAIADACTKLGADNPPDVRLGAKDALGALIERSIGNHPVAAAAIPMLVALLAPGDPACELVSELATACLAVLISGRDDDVDRAAATCAVVPLVGILRCNRCNMRNMRNRHDMHDMRNMRNMRFVAMAMANLALIDVNRIAMSAAGAIVPIVELLQCGEPDAVHEEAARALANLACNSHVRIEIIAGDATGLLLGLMSSSGNAKVRCEATHALRNMLRDVNNPGRISGVMLLDAARHYKLGAC